jgi:hypothetical protein
MSALKNRPPVLMARKTGPPRRVLAAVKPSNRQERARASFGRFAALSASLVGLLGCESDAPHEEPTAEHAEWQERCDRVCENLTRIGCQAEANCRDGCYSERVLDDNEGCLPEARAKYECLAESTSCDACAAEQDALFWCWTGPHPECIHNGGGRLGKCSCVWSEVPSYEVRCTATPDQTFPSCECLADGAFVGACTATIPNMDCGSSSGSLYGCCADLFGNPSENGPKN